MDNSLREALEYFRAGSNNLWKWSDDLQVIEWQSGETICYRKELMEILWSMQPAGLPEYLDTIILILASCKTNWNSGVYLKNIPFLKNEEVAKYYSEPDVAVRSSESTIFTIPDKMRELVPIFETIQALPYELKAETPKQHLLYEIFNRVHPRINALKSKTFLQTFEAGIIDSEIKFKNKHILTYERTWRMLNISGLNVKNLEYRLRTGLEKAPDSLPIPLPDPIPQTDDLLTQLTQDPQTAGLARLAKRLIAALNIPPHTRGASDQPLGGVSDISNRGDYDRLLLSELANDDDTLSARLVNNEALYLRRETPPDPQVQERMILVDVSLRLWGIPRVFATAAALGCALNNPQKAKITAFALGQEVSEPNALSNKEDVLHFLEKLSPALHPGEALKDFLRQNIISIHQSVFFITSEDVMADKNFALLLAEWIVHLNYLLVLNRSGELWMYKVVNGRRSLLTTTKFDLEEVLFGPSKKEALAGLMQTLSLKKATFDDGKTRTFLPTHPGRLAYPNLAFKEDILVAVLPCRRVWFWHGQTKGAIELLETIEEGRYSFHLNEQGVECIMVVTKDYAYFAYLFQQNTLAIQVDFGKKNIHYFSQEAATVPLAFEGRFEACSFVEGKLNFSVSKVNERGFNERTFVALDPGSNTLTPLAESPPFNLQWYRYRSLNPIKSIVNNGYSVLRNVKIFGISHEAYFNLDGFAMMLHEHQLWLKKANQSIHSKKPFLNWRSLDAQFYTRTIEYPNGHKIALDSRGFLLLFNPNSQEADITITLILEKELAAWTHDGYFTGNPYFFNAPADRTVSPSIFYNKYILPFIRKIQ